MPSHEGNSSHPLPDISRGERGKFAAAPGIRVAPDGMLRTRRKSSVDASSSGFPSGRRDFTAQPSATALSPIRAPQFSRPSFTDQHGSRAAQAIQSLIAATTPVLSQSYESISPTTRRVSEAVHHGTDPLSEDPHDSGEWGGCARASSPNAAVPAFSQDRPGDDNLSSPQFDILGLHLERTPTRSVNDPDNGHLSEDSASSDDYGKEQDAERDRRARSLTRRKQQRQKEREAEDIYHRANALPAQPPKPVHAAAQPYRAQSSGQPNHTHNPANSPRSDVPAVQPPAVDDDIPVILTGFDPMPDGCNEDDKYEEVEYTGKGKGKASSSGNKGGRMSAESVAACQQFGAEVHRSARTLAMELNMNLATVMRVAGLSLKATKVGNFHNSLRMVIRHEHAERVEQDSSLGMLHRFRN